ncbi:MAG TPA: hypothetical protein VND96_19510 [Candidatus Micrarchaeaceae archaeon]|nr:hypothetical protein [Candidatus Micrarchaeaceae archaeon]
MRVTQSGRSSLAWAHAAGFQTAIATVAILTAISGLIVWFRMPLRHWAQ